MPQRARSPRQVPGRSRALTSDTSWLPIGDQLVYDIAVPIADPSDSSRVALRPSSQVVMYLDELVEIGIYGKTRTEVVDGMVSREIERLIRDGVLKLHSKPRHRRSSV